MKPIKFLLAIFLMLTLVACIPGGSPTVPPEEIEKALNEIRTEVAQTLAAEMDKNIEATTEPMEPTEPIIPTSEPTNTSAPTDAPAPTSTLAPTATTVVLPTALPTATATAKPKPLISIIGIEKNTAITIQTENFPAQEVFKIRVGPFDTFFKDYVEVGTINSGNGGTFKFTVLLPESVKDVEQITVRLDSSSGEYAYNYFKNVTSGTIPAVATPVTNALCELSISPKLSTVMNPGEDFDAIWTIKNISGKTWEAGTVDYKFVQGAELHKYDKIYDLSNQVKSGDKVEIRVDMLAPHTAGTYAANWALTTGTTTLCNLPITIIVK